MLRIEILLLIFFSEFLQFCFVLVQRRGDGDVHEGAEGFYPEAPVVVGYGLSDVDAALLFELVVSGEQLREFFCGGFGVVG